MTDSRVKVLLLATMLAFGVALAGCMDAPEEATEGEGGEENGVVDGGEGAEGDDGGAAGGEDGGIY